MSTLAETQEVRLTQFSHGAGCGCKISPAILEKIIGHSEQQSEFSGLLVGNSSKDDAAVMELNDGRVVISTTDFFMPIVDDAYDFGRIASANAISDIYAMGGTPLMAIAILGWPINEIPLEVASQVLEGSRAICKEAGIPLAGGHSIDCPEPVFGLAVTGTADKKNIKTNTGAKEKDLLFLTKPLGVGILSTASKKGVITDEDLQTSIDNMTCLNSIGIELGKLEAVHALTDVTGFGLLGHLIEVCEGSSVSAEINIDNVPILHNVNNYLTMGCIPGGTNRNWDSYGHKVGEVDERTRQLLADPQTSGGLLIAVGEPDLYDFYSLMAEEGLSEIVSQPIGRIIKENEKRVILT
ncbi:MAG: selenide, water dikinase SelD [Bacteroidia bacterium]|nr:selenide, water dikinase SelD [Bacteroidia bacterium]